MFKKAEGVSANGTSFHNVTVVATYNELFALFGEPSCDGDGGYKVNVEWILTDEKGNVATIYDWKEPFDPSVQRDRQFEWHLGAAGYSGQRKPAAVCLELMSQIYQVLGPVKRPGTGPEKLYKRGSIL